MTEPKVNDPSPPTDQPDRRQTPRSAVPPPEHRPAAVFPYQPNRPEGPSAGGRVLLWEAVRRPRNLVPLALIVVLAIVGLGLLTARKAAPPPNDFLARLVVSSSQSSTSLFGNDRYLGEIGPKPREFTVVPGEIRLRLVRSRCRARDTTFELKIGERLAVGPLDPACGRP